MKTGLVIISLLLQTTLYGQTIVDEPIRDSVLVHKLDTLRYDGDTLWATRFHNNGSFKCEGIYIDKKKDGYWMRNHPNGQPYYKAYFRKGQVHGNGKLFYKNGQLAKEGNYSKGVLNGYFKTYDKKGTLIKSENYRNGKRHGRCEYFKEGKLEKSLSYENEALDGIAKWYYRNGNVKSKINYSKGVLDGAYTEFDKQGNSKRTTIYKNGKPVADS
ncbi:MAG: toxin-antitoxin system YwqK family antitoxin [Flavobacteriales bacterium]|nr:toxin-antitoxin system YwqK family antitoxin [Flavobacteriales bacterium]